MSNMGLNTNLFRVTGKYLDILNDFIVRARVKADISEQKKGELIDFLTRINDIENTQPQFQLLSSIIERELRQAQKSPGPFFKMLVNDLEKNDVDHALPNIEFIVEVLDSENTEALSKIKGD